VNIPHERYIKKIFVRVRHSTDVYETFISVRGVALKIPDERCRGKTRFPERNEMLVHVDPLCINKMRILNFSLARQFRQFRRTRGSLTSSCIPREEMETKISSGAANEIRQKGENCEARFIRVMGIVGAT